MSYYFVHPDAVPGTQQGTINISRIIGWTMFKYEVNSLILYISEFQFIILGIIIIYNTLLMQPFHEFIQGSFEFFLKLLLMFQIVHRRFIVWK